MSNSNPDHKWNESVSATAGNSSTPIYIPGWITEITAAAIPGGGGTATVQHTLAAQEAVEADPGAVQWIDWDAGSVNAVTSRSLSGAVTALRINAVGATCTLQVCGQRNRR